MRRAMVLFCHWPSLCKKVLDYKTRGVKNIQIDENEIFYASYLQAHAYKILAFYFRSSHPCCCYDVYND